MTIQTFDLYTKNGYAGDLVDSGPRKVGTGILVGAKAGFGKALKRNSTVDRGVELGGLANVYATSQRELNHEAGSRPSTGNDTVYNPTESVSIIRDGFVYVLLSGSVAISAGEVLHVDTVTGEFSKDAVAGNVIATTNVIAEEAGLAGDVIKVAINGVS